MASYSSLLDKTRVHQSALQKYAVTAIFTEIRSEPAGLGPDSGPARQAIAQCLRSPSPYVADQAVRELCRLVIDDKMALSDGFLELQSALEESRANFSPLFVKSIGFLTRFGFRKNSLTLNFSSAENHPFVKIVLSGPEVQRELVKEVVLLLGTCEELEMKRVCEFLKPFVNFSILRVGFSGSSPVSHAGYFAKDLFSAMASFCCSLPATTLPVLKLLASCFKFLPTRHVQESRFSFQLMESVVEAYMIILKRLVTDGLWSTSVVQCLGVELAEALLSLLTVGNAPYGVEWVFGLVMRLFEVQKDLNLLYIPELLSVKLSLLPFLLESEFEHEQLAVLKLVVFLVEWKYSYEHPSSQITCMRHEDLLLTFPVIHLVSSASQPVKTVATKLLMILQKNFIHDGKNNDFVPQINYFQINCRGAVIYRFLQNLLTKDRTVQLPSFPLFTVLTEKNIVEGLHSDAYLWGSVFRESCLRIMSKKKSSLSLSMVENTFITEMPPILCCIAVALVMDQSLGDGALDLLGAIGTVEPKLSITLLLVVLFYCNILSRKIVHHQKLIVKLLSVIPSLAVHLDMIPLVIQTIMPMLQKDAQPLMYATGIRLLTLAWACNDRIFGTLQAVLHPKVFNEFTLEKRVCLSLAASVLDVCHRDPDRGVDLILCVSSCIEMQDHIIQALGVQSLSYLCEADVIDFYTSWDIISRHLLDYTSDPILAQSICVLLRWGALDAEAYPEKLRNLLDVLWNVITSPNDAHTRKWCKARVSAITSLTQYEISHLESGIHDFKKKFTEILLHETNDEVLKAAEDLQVKIALHEHMNRQRFVKDKRIPRSKIEKLLDVVPEVLFPQGSHNAEKLPAAALICLSHTTKNIPSSIHTEYETAATEIAASLQLSRNILVAFLSLQSWKVFMQRWIKATIMPLDSKSPYSFGDKTTKVAINILESLIKISEEAIPRSSENVVLAIGALCLVVPPSGHVVKSNASKFLLNWLFQYEHEHMQWPAAISLGLISGCLHVTEHQLKLEIIYGLLGVFRNSKSSFVKGACGIGLGFSCQNLLMRTQISKDISHVFKGYKVQEVSLLYKIVSTMLLTVNKISNESNTVLECLHSSFHSVDAVMEAPPESLLCVADDVEEEDTWGIAGLVIGLGHSIDAIYRFGAIDVAAKLKEWIVSFIPKVESLIDSSVCSNIVSNQALSVGACLVLPILVSFSRRVDIMNDSELDYLLNGLSNAISKLTSDKNSNIFNHLLLTASCIGASQLLSYVLSEGVISLAANRVKHLLEMFRKTYSGSYHSIIQLGGMAAVANAMGSGLGFFCNANYFLSSIYQKDQITNQIGESYMTTLVQEIFLISQNENDITIQQNAAWIVSFLRNCWSTKEHVIDEQGFQIEAGRSNATPHKFSDDSSVLKLSEWLSNLKVQEMGIPHPCTLITILRCLTRAPRLPSVNWGSIIHKCMRYKEKIPDSMKLDSVYYKCMLREQCMVFSLTHANHFDALLSFLDEISDFPRFRALEHNMQRTLLLHIGALGKVFSNSRLNKFVSDVSEFFNGSLPYSGYDTNEKRLLRISCWNGLQCYLNDSPMEPSSTQIRKCIVVLFCTLPFGESSLSSEPAAVNSAEEWSVAISCLAGMPRDWLLEFLSVSAVSLKMELASQEHLKKIVANAKLVRNGSIPLSELSTLKSYLLNIQSNDTWNVLVEVAAAVHSAEGQVKRQWLCDTVDISCVSSFPSTAIQFLGLLSGSFCKYAPILLVDPVTVLSDLPITLNSLLSQSNWTPIAQTVASNLWISTKRVYQWYSSSDVQDHDAQNYPSINETKDDRSAFLLKVMYHTCVSLKDHLSLENQLFLANMVDDHQRD